MTNTQQSMSHLFLSASHFCELADTVFYLDPQLAERARQVISETELSSLYVGALDREIARNHGVLDDVLQQTSLTQANTLVGVMARATSGRLIPALLVEAGFTSDDAGDLRAQRCFELAERCAELT